MGGGVGCTCMVGVFVCWVGDILFDGWAVFVRWVGHDGVFSY